MTGITSEKFELIKVKYGNCASWAIWDAEAESPKSNIGNVDVLDPQKNKELLSQLNPNIIVVGLNISGRIKIPLANFHADSSTAMDYKIRYAFQNTILWGAYMTDIIKDYEEKISGNVMRYLKQNPSFLDDNIQIFLHELKDLGADNPRIITFGNDSYNILRNNLNEDIVIKKVIHYSHYVGREKYRENVLSAIKNLTKI